MINIDYYKLQAKNLHKDFKAKRVCFFPIPYQEVMKDYHFKKDTMGLMDAQHLVAQLSGFRTWKELINAPESVLTERRQMWEEYNYEMMTPSIYEEVKKNDVPTDNSMVECLHCGEKYHSSECKILRHKPQYRNGYIGDIEITVCKNYPKCNGQSWDLIPVETDGK